MEEKDSILSQHIRGDPNLDSGIREGLQEKVTFKWRNLHSPSVTVVFRYSPHESGD